MKYIKKKKKKKTICLVVRKKFLVSYLESCIQFKEYLEMKVKYKVKL